MGRQHEAVVAACVLVLAITLGLCHSAAATAPHDAAGHEAAAPTAGAHEVDVAADGVTTVGGEGGGGDDGSGGGLFARLSSSLSGMANSIDLGAAKQVAADAAAATVAATKRTASTAASATVEASKRAASSASDVLGTAASATLEKTTSAASATLGATSSAVGAATSGVRAAAAATSRTVSSTVDGAKQLATDAAAMPKMVQSAILSTTAEMLNVTSVYVGELMGVSPSEAARIVWGVVKGVLLLAVPLLAIWFLHVPAPLAFGLTACVAMFGWSAIASMFWALVKLVLYAVEFPVATLLALAIAAAVPWAEYLGRPLGAAASFVLNRVPFLATLYGFVAPRYGPPEMPVHAQLERVEAKIDALAADVAVLRAGGSSRGGGTTSGKKLGGGGKGTEARA